MAGANSNIQITDLDFNTIKNNLKTYLQSQDTLKDYNYDGSALSVLLDVLAYNTQYNAYYLNMVANEMFLDTALVRNSVVSQAKLLGYTPRSAVAPQAVINLSVQVYNRNEHVLTMPKYTNFLSEAINGVHYTFTTVDSVTVPVVNQEAKFNNVVIKQGTPATYSYLVDGASNPTYLFKLKDTNIDTSTLLVSVQQSSSNSSFQTYTEASNYLTLNGTSNVYFLQEGMNGFYEIYFGNGILGSKLNDGNIVNVSYLITAGSSATNANSFVLMDTVSGYADSTVSPILPATQGYDRETISSIKYQAPKNYSAQSRAITKEDYITAIQQNNLGYSFDAVNVWGGQDNNPPVYGQIFISMKPSGSYNLTETQKNRLIENVIKPISVMTVEPTIVDPDYTYIKVTANVYYDPKKTNKTATQIEDSVRTAIYNVGKSSLNTFNSTFSSYNFNSAINSVDSAIITNEISIQLQKKFYPILSRPTTYTFYYGAPLAKRMFLSGVNSSPSAQFRSTENPAIIISGVFVEEVPTSTGGVESLSILNKGFGYQYTPTVTISGDGSGATAVATINTDGTIKSITVTSSGNNYTSAIATITPASGDTTGKLGAATVTLQGQYGTLRTFYNNTQYVKTVLNSNAGTVDYVNGIVTLNSFSPVTVDNDLGQLTISANPTTTIISSTYNRIITIDPYDPNAIVVNVMAKTT
jgi:hypothetical protein